MCMDKGYDYPEVYKLLEEIKKVEKYVAMLHFACTCITFRAAGFFL